MSGITYWRNFHLDHLLRVVLVVQAITEHIAESLQSPLDRVSDGFLLSLVEEGLSVIQPKDVNGGQQEESPTLSSAAPFPLTFSL